MTRRDLFKAPAAAALAGSARASATSAEAAAQDHSQAFQRVTLEMSLKPFRSMDEPAIRSVCAKVFRDWAALIRRCGATSVMLWTADGSEILEYRGRMDDAIEWGRYLGDANPPRKPPADDPERQGAHARNWLFTQNPPRITYGSLRTIIRSLKEVGREMTGKPVVVGATFDPGGEFARSPFKFERHAEIAKGTTRGPASWVDCTARLKADSAAYAGYPKGIPDGTPFGAFLGRQSRHFLTDLGFDYIWFSNGLGFSLSPWSVTGPLFDGKTFDARRAPEVREAILSFWRDFRRECPDFPIETRGSNLIVGADLATSASPIGYLYDGKFGMTAPPNSPWAAIDGDFGLEIVGYLSRIAELPPDSKFPFRFYTHDPWWMNSPWFDRYGREPHDIYLPLSVARIDSEARITRPAYLEFLTIDDSYGNMPEQCPNEVTPRILECMDTYSDAPGLVTWVCPFREYHEMVFGKSPRPGEVFFADWFLRGAVNNGFPLNAVVSTGNFLTAWRNNPEFFKETVLLSLVPPGGSPLERALLDAIRQGQRVFLYGPVDRAGKEVLSLLNLAPASPISGEMELHTPLILSRVRQGTAATFLKHRENVSGGGVDTVLADPKLTAVRVCASVKQGGSERIYAVAREGLAWIRGSFCCEITGGLLPVPDDPTQFLQAESLVRPMLREFGHDLQVEKANPATRDPLILVSRHRNGFFFAGYSPSTATTVRLRLRHGAPLLVGTETWLERGLASYTMPRGWRREARCLVEQRAAGEISCMEHYAGHPGIRRRLRLRGLQRADVHFYPEDNGRVIMANNDMRLHNETSIPFASEDGGRRLVVRGITGELLISW